MTCEIARDIACDTSHVAYDMDPKRDDENLLCPVELHLSSLIPRPCQVTKSWLGGLEMYADCKSQHC